MNILTRLLPWFFQKKPASTVVYTDKSKTEFTCNTGRFIRLPENRYFNRDTLTWLTPLTFYASLDDSDKPHFKKPKHFREGMTFEEAQVKQKELDTAKENERLLAKWAEEEEVKAPRKDDDLGKRNTHGDQDWTNVPHDHTHDHSSHGH